MELAGADDFAGVGEQDRIVRHRVDLAREHVSHVRHRGLERTVDLGDAAQGIGVLNALGHRRAGGACLSGEGELARRLGHPLGAGDDAQHIARHKGLPGMGAGRVERWIEGVLFTAHGLQGERQAHVRMADHALGIGNGKDCHGQ